MDLPNMVPKSIDFFRSTPRRTFVLYPLVSVAAALFTRGRAFRIDVRCLPLLLWGYGQFHLVGMYISRHGRGTYNPRHPPTQLVTTGPYALTRNPMYVGHLVFMVGLTLALRSPVALALTAIHAYWFHTSRVRDDEQLLQQRYGEAYLAYTRQVKRWIPGLF